jgi:primosomal protein N' (replication factor Y)
VGVHLPVTLPCANLGLIIIDEEHETGYQEKKHPKIHTKEAALMRASLYQIPLVLGSATPSLTTLHNVHTKGWKLFELTKRFAGSFPTLQHVLLTDKRQRRSFWISTALEQAIKDRLLKREQVIIFLNRRGFSLFVQCKACSFTFMCPNCSVSLTLHGTNRLTCHYCGLHQTLPATCPQCQEKEDQFLKKGIGTQQVVTVLQKLFPMANIGRADLDASSRKTAWKQTLSDFEAGKIDIMVGTQTITKGYHFPRVTLVGIIWADLSLNFPIYNATEMALQQIVQVAGRAGRASFYKEPTQSDSTQKNISQGESSSNECSSNDMSFNTLSHGDISQSEVSSKTISPGHVIIQSMIDHPIFAYTREETYKKFYDHEMAARKMAGYPPFMRLAEIEIKHSREETVDRDAHSLGQKLMSQKRVLGLEVFILGPAKPYQKNLSQKLIIQRYTYTA